MCGCTSVTKWALVFAQAGMSYCIWHTGPLIDIPNIVFHSLIAGLSCREHIEIIDECSNMLYSIIGCDSFFKEKGFHFFESWMSLELVTLYSCFHFQISVFIFDCTFQVEVFVLFNICFPCFRSGMIEFISLINLILYYIKGNILL